MKIGIVGSGQVGSALALGLKGKGHEVLLGTRRPDEAAVQVLAGEAGARAVTPAEAVAAAEVVILALPWRVAKETVAALGPMAGKIVIDCMNPLQMVDGMLGLSVGHTTSGGEILQGWLPEARVVKTLNQVGAEVMTAAARMAHPPAMFMAGDDAAAKDVVAAVLTDLAFMPFDAGALRQARILEPLAMVWINQAVLQGKGRDWAFAAVGPAHPV